MKRSHLAILGGLVLVAAAGALALTLWPVEPEARLQPDDPALVAQGREVYEQSCASCHGAQLEGQANWRQRGADGRLPAPPHDASGHTWHHPDEILIELVAIGPAALVGGGYESDMPAYQGVLTEAEILAVLSYIKSTWPPEIRARHDRINEAAE